jgi:hypothetical protein
MPKSARLLTVVVGILLVVFAGSLGTGCRNQPAAKSTAPAASAPQTPAPAAPAAEQKAEADPADSSKFNAYGEPLHPGADFPVTMAFARDTRTFKIAPLDGVEFNYRMEKGGTMVYSWKASDSMTWDFHGEQKGAKAGYAESYATGEGKEGNGGFMAPWSGIHGWFWQNPSDKPVTVTLTTAGHYTEGLLTMPDDTKAPKPFDRR